MDATHQSHSGDFNPPAFCYLIKSTMAQKNLSLRQFSMRSGISASTLSRIISGKQKTTLAHMQTLAECLDIPLERLLEANGIILRNSSDEALMPFILTLQESLSQHQIDLPAVCGRIEKSLLQYEDYVRLDEGRQMVIGSFPSKLRGLCASGGVIDCLNALYMEFVQEEISPTRQALIGSGLLYFILTMDVIPDYLFPFGYLDDLMALQIVTQRMKE